MINAVENSFNTAHFLMYSILAWIAAVPAALAVIFLVQIFEFSHLQMAQATIGAFGFAGGLLHAVLLRKAGGKVSWKYTIFLAFVWAFCCMGCVTPLFFTSGMPLKMTVLAFYSFSTFGALGGFITSYSMKFLFEDATSVEIAPSVTAWSFGFGFAAITSEIITEFLQPFLPDMILWFLAFLMMALFIGCGAGYSAILFLKSKDKGKQVLHKTHISPTMPPNDKNAFYIGILVLLSTPFYLNDFSNIFITDWRLWILTDYVGVKLVPFAVVYGLIRTNKMTFESFGLTRVSFIKFGTVFLIATLAGTFIDQNGYLLPNIFPGYPPLGRIPAITNPLWRWIDLSIGLLMVGLSEELVFRGYLRTFLSRYTENIFVIIATSALAFGFIHWSGGLHTVLVTSIIGAVFMTIYMRTNSLFAIMLAHFAINFIDFADVIPKTLFRFY